MFTICLLRVHDPLLQRQLASCIRSCFWFFLSAANLVYDNPRAARKGWQAGFQPRGGSAGLFALLAAFTPSKIGTLLLLSLCYAGICFNGPMQFTICLDVATKSPGSMCGPMNTATQVGSFLLGVVFGYIAKISGSYDLPLILMALVLGFGALLWLKIDPEQELVPEDKPELGKALSPAHS